MYPRSKQWHYIDYFIVRRLDLHAVQITRAMCYAQCSTHHHLIRSTLRLTVRQHARRQKPMHKLNVHAVHNQNTREELRNAIAQSSYRMSTTTTSNCTSNLTMEWQVLSSVLLHASQSITWRDDIKTGSMTMPLTSVLLTTIKILHMMLLCGVHLFAIFMNVFSLYVRQYSASYGGWRTTGGRGWRLRYWDMRILMTQGAFVKHKKSLRANSHLLQSCQKYLWHPKNKEMILARWAEYLQGMLNKVHTTNPGFLDDQPTLLTIPKLDDPPSFDEVEKAILSLKDKKTARHDNIPAEAIKYGGCALHRRLHNFILDCWSAKCLPQQWKNANIVLAYKQRGNRAKCGNSRGIPLFSVAGKVLAKIILIRLLGHVVDFVVPES